MPSEKKLFSLDGFNFLTDVISTYNISKANLQDLLEGIYSTFETSLKSTQEENSKLISENVDIKKRGDKKRVQYQSLLDIIDALRISGRILEIGSGNGELTMLLAKKYFCEVYGVEKNQALVEKLRVRGVSKNTHFVSPEELPNINNDFGLVLGLHCCGNLSDEIMSLASKNSYQNGKVVCVPCCYGKLNTDSEILPRSNALASRKETFRYLIKRTRSLEGYVDDRQSRSSLLLELCRRVIDFDRVFYLNERGYYTRLVKLLSIKNGTQKDYSSDSLMCAIIGERNVVK